MQSSLTELMLGYHCEVAEATGMRVFHADGETTKRNNNGFILKDG